MSKIQIFVSVLFTACIVVVFGCSDECTVAKQEEQNKATIKMIHAELVKGNVDAFEEVLTDDYVRHCQAMPPELQEIHGAEKLKLFLEDFVGGISNYTDSIGPIVAEGNMVAYISTMHATQTGPMGGLPASGKDFKVVNAVIQRFENGKIAETWVTWDNVAVLSQLGFFQPPQQNNES